VSQYQKGKTSLDFTEEKDSEWQWHQLGHMQVCTSLQTDNHASTPPLSFFTGRMPFLLPKQQRQSTEGDIVKVVVSKKWCKIDTLLLHITNRKYHIAYRFVPFPMTLNDLGHSPVAGLIKCNLTNIFWRHFGRFQLIRHMSWSLAVLLVDSTCR